MSEQTTNGNQITNLPALVQPEPQDKHAATIEAITAVETEFRTFQYKVYHQMQAYRKALSGLTSDLYKDVYKRLICGDTMSFNSDPLFQGWHNHSYYACDQVDRGMQDMSFAFRQAKAYARALQRPREDGIAEANPYL